MAKLTKNQYRTLKGDIKVNCYKANIPKEIINESSIVPEKDIIIYAKENKIIIENKEEIK